ncbi:Uncharacterised protein [Klebsiella pneumoniae]|nr:Uncharacterised protein [Klebsiella pneumoniae]
MLLLMARVEGGGARVADLAVGRHFDVIQRAALHAEVATGHHLALVVEHAVGVDAEAAPGDDPGGVALFNPVFGDGAHVVVVGEAVAVGGVADHPLDAQDVDLILVDVDGVILVVIAHAVVEARHLVFGNVLLRHQHVLQRKVVVDVVEL